jgi:hypothetical protein
LASITSEGYLVIAASIHFQWFKRGSRERG